MLMFIARYCRNQGSEITPEEEGPPLWLYVITNSFRVSVSLNKYFDQTTNAHLGSHLSLHYLLATITQEESEVECSHT